MFGGRRSNRAFIGEALVERPIDTYPTIMRESYGQIKELSQKLLNGGDHREIPYANGSNLSLRVLRDGEVINGVYNYCGDNTHYRLVFTTVNNRDTDILTIALHNQGDLSEEEAYVFTIRRDDGPVLTDRIDENGCRQIVVNGSRAKAEEYAERVIGTLQAVDTYVDEDEFARVPVTMGRWVIAEQ